ncbi:hypothetical protein Nmel_010774, partial [Mimus melanotis]
MLFGVKHAIPEAMNWSKLYEVKKDSSESHLTFMERFKVTARKYTNLDPENPKETVQLATVML